MHYKILTHDFRSPLQGGDPIFDGVKFPFELARVTLDTGPDECAAGWNCCDNLANALKIVGLWPNGRPSVGFIVEPSKDAIQRGNKTRSSGMTIIRPVSEKEMVAGIRELSQPFGALRDEMVAEQLAWRRALSRPKRDEAAIVNGLELALKTRGLNWSLLRFDSAKAAWDARDAWDAWDALTVFSAARHGWVKHDAHYLTLGIRDAYESGLEIAIPVGNSVLGWA